MFISPARVCYLYYEKGLTQKQIGDMFGINRIRVSRILHQGRAEGIVSIKINFRGFFPEMESALRLLHRGVQFVICDPLDGSFEESRHAIAATAADYLDVAIGPNEQVAVGWGRTLRETAANLTASLPGASFVPLIGGQTGLGLDVHANSIAEVMARRTGGQAGRIFSPAVADSKAERDVLVGTPSIAAALDAAASATTCLFSLEDPSHPESTLSLVGYLSEREIETLRQEGAACDLLSIGFYDEQGERCATQVSDRSVSITEEQFRAYPRKICLAGGRTKHEAIAIALRLHLIDVLITDAETASHLIGDEDLLRDAREAWSVHA